MIKTFKSLQQLQQSVQQQLQQHPDPSLPHVERLNRSFHLPQNTEEQEK